MADVDMADAPPAVEAAGPSVMIDALPYYDSQLNDPAVAIVVDKMVAKEMRNSAPREDALDHLPAPELSFQSKIIRREMERMAAEKPMEPLDMSRYMVEAPDARGSESAQLKAWEAAVDNARARLEDGHLRMANCDLMAKYGPNAWRVHNMILEENIAGFAPLLCALTKHRTNRAIDAVQEKITDINRLRQTEQGETGKKLAILEERYTAQARKNLEIQAACVILEKELGLRED